MESNEFLKVRIKNRTCYYFDEITKLEDFDIDNILIDEMGILNIDLNNINLGNNFDEYDSDIFILVRPGILNLKNAKH